MTVIDQEIINAPSWLLHDVVNVSAIFLICILAANCIACFGCASLMTVKDYRRFKKVILGMFIALCLIITTIIICNNKYNEPDKIKYRVLIDDTISFNEIMDHYTDVERDGNIYILTEPCDKGEKQ